MYHRRHRHHHYHHHHNNESTTITPHTLHHCIDCHLSVSEPSTFISAVLLVASSMLRLGLPHVNVLSKVSTTIQNHRASVFGSSADPSQTSSVHHFFDWDPPANRTRSYVMPSIPHTTTCTLPHPLLLYPSPNFYLFFRSIYCLCMDLCHFPWIFSRKWWILLHCCAI